ETEVAAAGYLLLGASAHFLPLGEPAARPGNGEEHGEHFHREAHGLVDEPGIEVHVRIELARDEILVLERDPLELEGHGEERAGPGHLEHLVGHALDDFAP